MKRVYAFMLCLALAAGLAVPVLAEGEADPEVAIVDVAAPEEETPADGEPEAAQGVDTELAALTLQVKETLAVDDDYTSFSSDYYDGPSPQWSLYWSDETRQLSVQARPDGTVMNMNFWRDSERSGRFYGFDPAFPALRYDEARTRAEEWCGRLFTGAESGQVDEIRIFLEGDGYYRVSGTVLENGLPSPITFTMIIDKDGMTSFYRSDDSGYVGELPTADTERYADPAPALAGAVELELRWVSDGEGGASLRYVPVGPRIVVDPETGEAVDVDALYEALGEKGRNYAYDAMSAAEAPMAEQAMADGGVSLTETELASIENYGDVLDQTALDEALRGYEALGLDGFELVRCSYAMDSETEDVTASIRYTGTMTKERLYGYSEDAFDAAAANGQDMTIYKYFTLDAKTGALKSVSTSYPIWEEPEDAPGPEVQAELAVSFAELVVPELADQTAGCTLKGYDERENVVLAQVHEGYFYPDNRIEVHADPASGVVDQFWYSWDEDVSFGPAEDVIDQDEALAAYTAALDVTLGYVAWPIDVLAADSDLYARYIQWGYTYVEELRLAYYYSGTDKVRGVDAVTGEAVRTEERSDTYGYDDLADVPQAEEIELLGAAGVGFSGGKFCPEAELTLRDAVILLLQAGSAYAPEDDERLAEQAYYQGLIPARDWEPDGAVSRMAFLRMLLAPSKYGFAAELTGVWDAGFEDVAEADAAMAAIARALGLAEGKTLEPDETLKRADAADILYRFMDR